MSWLDSPDVNVGWGADSPYAYKGGGEGYGTTTYGSVPVEGVEQKGAATYKPTAGAAISPVIDQAVNTKGFGLLGEEAADKATEGFVDGVNMSLLDDAAEGAIGAGTDVATDVAADAATDAASDISGMGASMAVDAGLAALGVDPNSVAGNAAGAVTNFYTGNYAGAAMDVAKGVAALAGDDGGAERAKQEAEARNKQMMQQLQAGGGARGRSARAAQSFGRRGSLV